MKNDLTKRHFEMIAQAIRTLPDGSDREAIARHFARELAHTNSSFDCERFVRACIGADERPHARERRKASLRAGKERLRAALGGVRFGTLQPDGTVTNERTLSHDAIGACPFVIMSPDHYRDDGSCKCNDPDHRAMMVREWGYSADDFKRAGLS